MLEIIPVLNRAYIKEKQRFRSIYIFLPFKTTNIFVFTLSAESK